MALVRAAVIAQAREQVVHHVAAIVLRNVQLHAEVVAAVVAAAGARQDAPTIAVSIAATVLIIHQTTPYLRLQVQLMDTSM